MRTVTMVALAAGACLAPVLSSAQTGKGLSAADVSKINEVTLAQLKAGPAKDWATMAAQYTDDAVINPANEPAVRGRKGSSTGFPEW